MIKPPRQLGECTLSIWKREGEAGEFYKSFKNYFVAQGTTELNVSWSSTFFVKYFVVLPINFSFLFKACLRQYFRVVFTLLFKGLKGLILTIIFKQQYSLQSSIKYSFYFSN